MTLVLSTFAMTLKPGDSRDQKNTMGNRRLKGWWDSIPVPPVEVVVQKGEETETTKESEKKSE